MALVETKFRADVRTLRSFGLICLCFFSIAGMWVYFRRTFLAFEFADSAALKAAYSLWGLSVYCGLFAVAYPRLVYPVYFVMMLVALPIGFVISHTILAVVYYGLFTPLGLVFRLMRRDALHRGFDEQSSSYWVERPKNRGHERYFRQY